MVTDRSKDRNCHLYIKFQLKIKFKIQWIWSFYKLSDMGSQNVCCIREASKTSISASSLTERLWSLWTLHCIALCLDEHWSHFVHITSDKDKNTPVKINIPNWHKKIGIIYNAQIRFFFLLGNFGDFLGLEH